MKQGIYTLYSNSEIASSIWQMRLEGDTSAFSRGGQFADIALQGRFLRRPLAATTWDEKGFTVIYKQVGEGTREMTALKPGAKLDVLTGLGNGFDASRCKEAALVVCGGLGASPAFSLVKELLDSGRKVTLILGFNTKADAVLLEEYRAMGADPVIATLDGSLGIKGLVTDAIKAINPQYDFFYTCGPKVMMKAVCEALEGSGQASLEERMGCGAGFCYGCTCKTTKGPKRICADGPVFDKEEIIW